jgi:diacylglycerol O-acyltransferase / wax synthase
MNLGLPEFDRRMSDAERLMWRLDRDPHLSSTFANISILDRPVDLERFRRRIELATAMVPRLRQRVHEPPAGLSAPVWVDDHDFRLDDHVRRIALPRPGTMRQLTDLAALIVADPFDRSRPLWQFWLVEGLKGGRSALIQKLHHAVADGEGSIALAMAYLDLERDAPDPPIPDPVPSSPGQGDDTDYPGRDALRDLVTGSLRLPLGLVRQVRDLLADPGQLPDATASLADTVRGVMSQLSEVDRARSPIWVKRSVRRHLEVLRAPFSDTKAAARRHGGTLNTAFMTLAADAASRYHERVGTPVETLRASMAVSTRTEGSGANAFSLVRLLVPTGPLSIEERFAAINEATATARSATSTESLDAIATLATSLPASVVNRLARVQAQTVDFATSNVRGAPIPVYVAGAQLLENYPLGPLVGVAFNLTLLSYHGSLDMGLHVDPVAVEDPALLRRCLERSVRRLIES